MDEVLAELLRRCDDGDAVALATVVETWRSAPHPAGAAMLVGPDGSVTGSVSGGCVEAALHESCQEALRTGRPALLRFGVTGRDAFAAGLTCGGTIDVYVERVTSAGFPELAVLAEAVRSGAAVAVLTCVRGPAGRLGRRIVAGPDDHHGTLGDTRLDEAAVTAGRRLLAEGRSGPLRLPPDDCGAADQVTVLVRSYAPPPRLIVFGAIDVAAELARIGVVLGYRVTVCDARPVFATARRFPQAQEVVVDWPHRYLAAEVAAGRLNERTAVCVLTHDAKFDVPALRLALDLELGFVGAMGSRRTHHDRLGRLREAGVTEAALARLSSPVGLDLGGRSAAETAVSIAAELVAVRNGRRGGRLRDATGSIHG
ncbi:xanthine/CO dehydrogenase maturation factor [Micromonospora sp. ATCC 39149]|uniref:XdhC family protein n=1 Tax=Micromonospora carbonacea TaxID=47853 RepID=A0A7D6CG67_9ACTN|nr:XdhC/CoxI family protein [Micromonospora sp. ATCC 39149]EEP74994.1 xanthine/CO dehydrogenase maturation factor [Micromonospora sp. ATCC 39149]QLK00736.1 XdhC family protein [Micromonospora carbonacea]